MRLDESWSVPKLIFALSKVLDPLIRHLYALSIRQIYELGIKVHPQRLVRLLLLNH